MSTGFYVSGRDVWLWIDPSQACNIACELCYTRPSHRTKFLTYADLNLMIDNLQEKEDLNVREITFNWRGEPLMNKRFPELLELLVNRMPGVRVQFHTNAMLLSESMCERLIAIKAPFHVYLSIDGGNKAAHERNRGIGTFDRAVQGGLRLLTMRNDAPWPHISLYQLDLRLALGAYDADFLMLANAADAWQRVSPIVRSGTDSVIAAATPSRDGVNPSTLWDADYVGPQPKGACFWAGYSLAISPTGDASVCILNQLSQPEGVLGNLVRQPISDILVAASKFREKLENRDRSQIPHCASCFKVSGKPRPPRPVNDLRLTFDGRI